MGECLERRELRRRQRKCSFNLSGSVKCRNSCAQLSKQAMGRYKEVPHSIELPSLGSTACGSSLPETSITWAVVLADRPLRQVLVEHS